MAKNTTRYSGTCGACCLDSDSLITCPRCKMAVCPDCRSELAQNGIRFHGPIPEYCDQCVPPMNDSLEKHHIYHQIYGHRYTKEK